MPVNYNFKNVAALPGGRSPVNHGLRNDDYHPVLLALVSLTLLIGINEINDTTLDDFCERVLMTQRVVGPLLYLGPGEKAYITPEDIKLYKGLLTNASKLSRKQFEANLIERLAWHPLRNEHDYSAFQMFEKHWEALKGQK